MSQFIRIPPAHGTLAGGVGQPASPLGGINFGPAPTYQNGVFRWSARCHTARGFPVGAAWRAATVSASH